MFSEWSLILFQSLAQKRVCCTLMIMVKTIDGPQVEQIREHTLVTTVGGGERKREGVSHLILVLGLCQINVATPSAYIMHHHHIAHCRTLLWSLSKCTIITLLTVIPRSGHSPRAPSSHCSLSGLAMVTLQVYHHHIAHCRTLLWSLSITLLVHASHF